ncbi:MAG: hybrid sensor histidine kinase/response regulator, partial [Leptolyngbyaceae cyanobacterium CRU_2_3]|nr:hybrid sensor histidine kinase/response regulator [Leptolyngbyaceae cyanobacterium CRU_2_3]
IDDQINGFRVIKALLNQEGYNLVYMASGKESLNQLAAIAPDVILLDVMMPDMDGIEVCRHIKSNPAWQAIPVIIVTALASKEDLVCALAAGADDFITKPVNGLELRARVSSMLRIKQQYDALKATLLLRETMSNMIVHDLRNPIATIMLSAELLLLDDFQGKKLERVQMILTCARTLNSLIDDLLLMAKMEAGKLLLKQTKVDLSALATVVLSDFQEVACSRKLHLEKQIPEAKYWISADANLLHRLMDNLLSNAIKFSPVGGQITLHIQYPSDSISDGSLPVRARIQVSDEGPGVKKELRQQIFKKYETGEAISNSTQIGLGLTFCKIVAEAHGGKIFVEDNLPKGSIFTVEI